jgi:hypothetical protein
VPLTDRVATLTAYASYGRGREPIVLCAMDLGNAQLEQACLVMARELASEGVLSFSCGVR